MVACTKRSLRSEWANLALNPLVGWARKGGKSAAQQNPADGSLRGWTAPSRENAEEHAPQAEELYVYCSLTLSMSAIRLSSGSERAFIFRIRLVRCTFTVDSAMPI